MHRNVPFLQPGRDLIGCPGFLESQFGVGMEITPDGRNFMGPGGNGIKQLHDAGLSLGLNNKVE
jgi:hypothetical protein